MSTRVSSQVDRSYAYLLDRMFSGDLKPGDRIEIDAVMAALEISRQPIRDAINRLALESFVEVVPQVGCVVSRWDARKREDVLSIGALINEEVSALAAVRRSDDQLRDLIAIHSEIDAFLDGEWRSSDDVARTCWELNKRFHDVLFSSIDSPALEALARSFSNRCSFAIVSERFAKNSQRQVSACEDEDAYLALFRAGNRGHSSIIDALERGDPLAARAASRAHDDLARPEP